MHPDFAKILQNFIRQYGSEKGRQYYYAWLNKHKLDDTKPYKNQDQLGECVGAFCESFRWLDEPLIKYYKEDKDAKYYKCMALTCNVSMNRNNYQGLDTATAGSIRWRPLNLNHNPETTLPFPENRVDYAELEDNGLETIIRIHNDQREIQRKIEKGDILHPSIEGEPRGMEFSDEGRSPLKWNFTALALLEKDVTLPGDPLTYLVPIAVNESMGSSLLESLSLEGDDNMNEEEKLDEATTEPSELKEDYEAPFGVTVCGQCTFFEDMVNTTTKIQHATGGDSADITRTEGSFGPGVGKCRIAEAGGVSKFVKKNDPACTDAAPRASPTGPERTIENKDDGVNEIEEIEKKALEATYEARLADKDEKILAEQKKVSDEMERRLLKEREISDISLKLNEKTRELTDVATKLDLRTQERDELRAKVDELNEEIGKLRVGIDITDKDVKEIQDENDSYKRIIEKLKETSLTQEQKLLEQTRRSNDESEKRASAVQKAENAVNDKIRIQQEAAQLREEFTQKLQEYTELSQRLSDSSKRELKLQGEVTEMRKKMDEYINSIRELKQELSKRPKTVRVKI
jgi:hypothetical protein